MWYIYICKFCFTNIFVILLCVGHVLPTNDTVYKNFHCVAIYFKNIISCIVFSIIIIDLCKHFCIRLQKLLQVYVTSSYIAKHLTYITFHSLSHHKFIYISFFQLIHVGQNQLILPRKMYPYQVVKEVLLQDYVVNSAADTATFIMVREHCTNGATLMYTQASVLPIISQLAGGSCLNKLHRLTSKF